MIFAIRTIFGGAGPSNEHMGEKNRTKRQGAQRFSCCFFLNNNNDEIALIYSHTMRDGFERDPNSESYQDDGYGFIESRPDWSKVEVTRSWQEYSENWWSEYLDNIFDRPTKKQALTGTDWPLRLIIVTKKVDQESGELIEWVKINKFHTAAILEELFAQQMNILQSAVAVKESLRVRVNYHEEKAEEGASFSLLNSHKQGIDDIYVLWKLHYVAAEITSELIDFIQRETVLNGGSILKDFRHYTFEGYPLCYQDEVLYHQVTEAFGITGLKWIGSPAFHLRANPDDTPYTPMNPDDCKRCYVLDRDPFCGMLLFFPDEQEEDRRYVWEDESRVQCGYEGSRAERGRELIAANPRLVNSVWEEPVLPEPAAEDPCTRHLRFY